MMLADAIAVNPATCQGSTVTVFFPLRHWGQSRSGQGHFTAGTSPPGGPPFSLVNPAVLPKVESLWPFKASLVHTGERLMVEGSPGE